MNVRNIVFSVRKFIHDANFKVEVPLGSPNPNRPPCCGVCLWGGRYATARDTYQRSMGLMQNA